MVTAFAGVLLLVLAATVALPQPVTSHLENRDLAKQPKATLGRLVSGRYCRDWDTYLVDHVAYRESWVKAYAFITMRVLGKPDMADVIVGKGGRLLVRPSVAPLPYRPALRQRAEIAARRLTTLAEFTRTNGGDFLFVGVPSPDSSLRAAYPPYYPFAGTSADLSADDFYRAAAGGGVKTVDLRTAFGRQDVERLYLQTDHHWTLEGAFVGYTEMARALGIRPRDRSTWHFVDLPNEFEGSRSRQVGFAFRTSEHLQIPQPASTDPCTITIEGHRVQSLYSLQADPSKPIGYSVYLGGNRPEVVIDTGRPELPDLLLFGDSYKQALVPFAYTHFDQTRVVDLRNYDRMSLYRYISTYKPDYVVMIANQVPPPGTGIGAFGKPPAQNPKPGDASAEATSTPQRP
jgi:hypothetical protein